MSQRELHPLLKFTVPDVEGSLETLEAPLAEEEEAACRGTAGAAVGFAQPAMPPVQRRRLGAGLLGAGLAAAALAAFQVQASHGRLRTRESVGLSVARLCSDLQGLGVQQQHQRNKADDVQLHRWQQFWCGYGERRYGERRYGECRYGECRYGRRPELPGKGRGIRCQGSEWWRRGRRLLWRQCQRWRVLRRLWRPGDRMLRS